MSAATTTTVNVKSSVLPASSVTVYVNVVDVKTAVGFPLNRREFAVKVIPPGNVGESE